MLRSPEINNKDVLEKLSHICAIIQNLYWEELNSYIKWYEEEHEVRLSCNGTYERKIKVPFEDGAYFEVKFVMQVLRKPGTKKTKTFQGSMFLPRCKYLLPDAARIVRGYFSLKKSKKESLSKTLFRHGIRKETVKRWILKIASSFAGTLVARFLQDEGTISTPATADGCRSLDDHIDRLSQMWNDHLKGGLILLF